MNLAPTLQQVDRTRVLFKGRKFDYFSGTDYLRLSSHPVILAAIKTGLARYGLNVAASRKTTGNHELFVQLEKSLAKFFRAETASLASNGYVPSQMAAQALAGQFSHVLMDERAHLSLLDASIFFDCPILKFKHRDPADLAKILRRLGLVKPVILTDGMYSRDGTIAPLKEYLALLPHGGMLLVDDSHAVGVVGKTGRGSIEHAGIARDRVIQTITLSKAFGVYGGAVIGSKALREAIIAKSRVFVGNTPLPLPLAYAAIKSLELYQRDPSLHARLMQNAVYVKDKLRAAGFPIVESPCPIIPLFPKNAKMTAALRRKFLAAGIYPPFTQYPGAPAGGYYRFVLSSEHSRRQLDGLVGSLIS